MNPSLATNPKPSQWISLSGNRVVVRVGKIEIGQGIGIALRQIAADELCLPLDAFEYRAGDTDDTPDELWTSASISVETGGGALRLVCAAVRHRALQAAGELLGCEKIDVEIVDGRFKFAHAAHDLSYGDLGQHIDLEVPPEPHETPLNRELYRTVGRSVPRSDLHQKLTGAGFIHDIVIPGMVHGRVVLPPHPAAQLISFDRGSLLSLAGIIDVVVDGNFIALACEREEQAIAAQAKAEKAAQWTAASDGLDDPVEALLERFDGKVQPVVGEMTFEGAVKFRFTRPFLAHASIGLCCALANLEDKQLHVISHSQGIYPLRDAIAKAVDISDLPVRVTHADGAGCYGHNGADDVALDAALLAVKIGRPVRMLWTRAQEFQNAPAGPAMQVDLSASLGADNRVTTWRHHIKGFTHLTRPGWGDGVNLSSAWGLSSPQKPSPTADPGQVPYGGAGCRNAPPIYDMPAFADYALIQERPLRTSAVRALGAHVNVFAIESMMDELAEACGQDPLTFRQNHLSDPRAIHVLKRVAELSDWPPKPSDGSTGTGIGFARYKNKAAYCALVVELELDESVRATKAWAVVDAGLAINPDGIKNQIEGGILQSLSFTLKEELARREGRFAAETWDDYPILGFNEVPDLVVEIVDNPDEEPLGVGECATGPTAGAVGNALKNALGVRLCSLPLTIERITQALM